VAENQNEINLLTPSGPALPALVAAAGPKASRHFVEFFTAKIRNKNTRDAYRRNITAFLAWFHAEAGVALDMIEPMVVAAYVEKITQRRIIEADGQAAPGRDPHAVRLDRGGRHSGDEPGLGGARAHAS
jgi:hypothetical protein